MTKAAVATRLTLSVSPRALEDFLYTEARLLDRWMLNEWLELFADDGRYQVAPAGVEDDADPEELLFYIDDDRALLSERVSRLYKRTAHAEFPHSKTRHMVSNVQILGGDDARFQAAANYLVFRTKFGETEIFPGHYLYDLRLRDGAIQILKKTCFLDIANLYEQAKVSIIL
ncbi:MAG: aromatic-ring-hydroxylating dioxygenase subunit beta [Hyphomonadaceae bacterium]